MFAGRDAKDVNPVVRAMLEPLSRYYSNTEVVEMFVVGAGNVHIEYRGKPVEHIVDRSLTLGTLERIFKTLANYFDINFDPVHAPNLSCTLPGGHRLEALVGASVQEGVSVAIRCKHPFAACPADFGLDDEIANTLLDAVDQGKTIVISGGMGTGKTTLLNLLVTSLPKSTRVICAEDTPEIFYDQFPTGVGLLSKRSADTAGQLEWPGIISHIQRITPDRIVVGEISIHNVQASMNLLNAGVPGFMCSIHADSSRLAIESKFEANLDIAQKSMQGVKHLLRELIDLVVQVNVTFDGTIKRRHVVEVLDVQSGVNLINGEQLLFETPSNNNLVQFG